MKCQYEFYNDEEFMNLIKPIIDTPNFEYMKNIPQHKNSSLYIHSILVAYNCYLAVKNNKKYNMNIVIRGALLHDYFLYDWRKNKDLVNHGFNHPKIALKNAKKEYDLCDKEIDIILNHMWPLTLFHIPKSKEAWLISRIDKKVTIYEVFKKDLKSIIYSKLCY